MGLSLKPLQSIWNDVATPADNAVRTVGNVAALGYNNAIGNTQGANQSRTALDTSASNVNNEAITPIANFLESPIRAALGSGIGLGTDLINQAQGTNFTTPQIMAASNSPITNALDSYATNHHNNQNLSSAPSEAGNDLMVGTTIVGGKVGDMVESGVSRYAPQLLKDAVSRTAATVLPRQIVSRIAGKEVSNTVADNVVTKAISKPIEGAILGAPYGAGNYAASTNKPTLSGAGHAALSGSEVGTGLGILGGVRDMSAGLKAGLSPEMQTAIDNANNSGIPGAQSPEPGAQPSGDARPLTPDEVNQVTSNQPKQTPQTPDQTPQTPQTPTDPNVAPPVRPAPPVVQDTSPVDQASELTTKMLNGEIDQPTYEKSIDDLQNKSRDIKGLAPDPIKTYKTALSAGLDNNTATAIANVAHSYREIDHTGDNPFGILRKYLGRKQEIAAAVRVANKSIAAFLGKDKQLLQEYRDTMEGLKYRNPDPRVAALVKATKPLEDQTYKFYQKIHGTKYADNHFSRFGLNGKTVEERVKGKVNVVKDKLGLSTQSPHTNARAIQRFVAEDNSHELFGSAKEHGLAQNTKDQTLFTNSKGQKYRVGQTSAFELENETGRKYDKNGARIFQQYHQNSANMVASQNTINALINSGHLIKLGDSDEVPAGYKALKAPGLRGYAAPSKLAGEIHNTLGGDESSGVGWQALDKIQGAITNTIVANPIFHGLNQYTQAMIAAGDTPLYDGSTAHSFTLGMARVNKQLFKYATDSEFRAQIDAHMQDHGMSTAEFNTFKQGPLYNALEHVHLGGLTKVSSRTMYHMEKSFRAAAYADKIEQGVKPEVAVEQINHFLGDEKSMGKVYRRTFMFAHYSKTMTSSLYGSLRHPLANAGATSNALSLWAMQQALNYGWQEYTGNKQASVRAGGEIGFGESLAKAPSQLERGQIPSVITGHLNPLLTYGTELATNRDLTRPMWGASAKTNTIGGDMGEGKGQLAVKTLVGPGYTINNTMSGKSSLAEDALSYGGGIYAPHVKGYQAATTPQASWLNTPGAKPTTGGAVLQYYQALDKYTGGLNSDDQAAYDVINPTTKNAAGHYMIKPTVFDSSEKASVYLAHPNVLTATTAMNQKLQSEGQKIDPFFTLPHKEQVAYLEKSAQDGFKDNPGQLANWDNHNKSWSVPFETARAQFYNSLPPGDPNKPQIPVQPPKENGNVSNLYTQYNALTDPQKRAQFMSSNPALGQYMGAYTQYVNKLLSAQGVAPLRAYPTASPEISSYTSTYMAATKAARTAMRTGNPTDFNNMELYLAQATRWETDKQASIDSISQQAQPAQAYMKDIHNMGQYDIAQGVNPSGQSVYSFNPQLAYSGGVQNGIVYKANPYGGAGGGSKNASGSTNGMPGFFSRGGKTDTLGANYFTTVGGISSHHRNTIIKGPTNAKKAKGLYQGKSKDSFIQGNRLKIKHATVKVKG